MVDAFVGVVARAIDCNEQTLAAVKEIVAREWNDPADGPGYTGPDFNREWRIGGAITDALHLSIGHPGGGEPEDVRWEYTILMNLIYHVGDAELGRYCMEHYAPQTE